MYWIGTYATGMSPVKIPDRVIDLSEYIDISRYTIYHKAHVRLSSDYRVNTDTNITIIDNPGKCRYDVTVFQTPVSSDASYKM